VVLLWLSGNLWYKQWTKRVGLPYVACIIAQPGVNFINILRTNFLFKSALRSLFLVTFWLWNFLAKKAWVKCWWNWHLFIRSFVFMSQTCTNSSCCWSVRWTWSDWEICLHSALEPRGSTRPSRGAWTTARPTTSSAQPGPPIWSARGMEACLEINFKQNLILNLFKIFE